MADPAASDEIEVKPAPSGVFDDYDAIKSVERPLGDDPLRADANSEARKAAADNPYLDTLRIEEAERSGNPIRELPAVVEQRTIAKYGYEPRDQEIAAGTPNPYLDMLNQQEEMDNQQRRIILRTVLASEINPDRHAEALKLSRATGLPVPLVARNADIVRRQMQLEEGEVIMKYSPSLAKRMLDPNFAGLAHDDLPTLSTVEHIAKALGGGVAQATLGISESVLRTPEAIGRVAEYASEAVEDFTGLHRNLNPVRGVQDVAEFFARGKLPGTSTQMGGASDWANRVNKTQEDLATNAATFGETFKRLSEKGRAADDALSAAVRGDVGQLGQVLTDPEAWAGFLGQAVPSLYTAYKSGGSLPFMAWLEAMGTANDAAAFEARTGVHVDPEKYTQALAQVALLNSALEKFGLDKVLGAKGGGLAGTIKATLAESGTEAMQQLNSNVAQLVAYNPNQSLSQGVLGSAMGGAVSGGGTHGFVSAVNAGVTKARRSEQAAAAAVRDAQTLQTLSSTAAESKLNARNHAAFGAFVEAAVLESGSPVTDLYVRAADFTNALAQAGIEPASVVQLAPSLASQVAEAIQTNGDLRIPLGEYAAAIAGTKANDALLPHLRTTPEAMSQAEAVLWQEQAGEEFKAEAERIIAGRQEGQEATTVQDSVLGQLRRAGRFTDDVNAAYAGLVGTFYTAMAERIGTTPEALFEQFPVNVAAESPAGPQTLGQTVVGQIRQVYQSITGAALAQSTNATPEGPANARGSYSIADHTIALLKNADLSTFLHESGHFFLEALADIAAKPEAPQELKDDMGAVLQWFGVPDLATWQAMTLEQKRPHHEQFARGFEAYAFEGNAPNIEMQGVFARFRAWLLNVYRSMTALNVQLTDEVRGVFDRMLATKDQITATEAARSYRPLFDNAADLNMSPDQWAEYQKLGASATSDAVASLERRSLRDMQWLANAKGRKLRELQHAAADKRAVIEAEVQAEVAREPLYAAMRFLKRGELPEGNRTNAQRRIEEQAGMVGARLSLPALKEMYGEGPAAPWRYLATGQYGTVTAEDGLHPDEVAELFGFTSGDELVRKILAAEPESTVVEGITDQRMLERYGDLSSPQALERAAEAAIHNDARARFLEREVNLLARAVGNKPVLLKAARAFAEQSIARKKVRELRPSQYSVAEGRAAREATQAFKNGDTATAAAAKRAQLLNNQMQRATGKAVEEIEKGVRYLREAGNSATIDPEYKDQIAALLDRFDLRKITNIEAQRRESLLDWVEEQRELGHEPVIPAELLNEAQRQPYREMTVEAFRGLVDAVKNIEHLGRLKHKLLTAADERAFAVRVDEAVRSVEDNARRTLPEKLESNRWADKLKDGVSEFFAMHRKFASLMREMDGFKDAGALWDLFVRPMNKAGDTEAVMREQATVKLAELFKPILAAGKLRQKVFIPEINASLSREGRIVVALNTGNEGNLQRLMDGDKWTPAQVRAITDTLSKEEWDFVQSIWDFIGSYREEVGAQQKRLTGIEPEWIDATPVRTKFGVYGGGYFPAKYDTNRSTRSLADEASSNIMDMWRGKRGLAKARDSFTKARAEKVVNRPLRKDFGVITRHVTEVTHRLAWQEYLSDANRLLRAGPLDNAIRHHYGPQVLKAMRDTIEDVAIGEVGTQNILESGANHLRSGATIAGLGWRVTTSLLQPLGLTQSMVRIGPKYVARGIVEWLGDAAKMENTAKRIYDKSDFMRLRAKTMQREISEIRNKVAGKTSAIEASYFYLIQKMQLVADIPTWLGQYHKAIESGATEAAAIAQADQAVIDAQGSGQIKDLAGVQRGGPYAKLFTVFYSFFNTTYNLTAESIGRTKFTDPVAIGRLAVDMLLLYSVPAALGTLLKAALGGDWDDEEKLVRRLIADQLTYLFGTMVGLRELAGTAQTALGLPGDYQGPAAVRLFAEMAKLGKQAGQGDVDEALLKAADNVGGILLHYPAGQLNATGSGLWAMLNGRTENPGALLVGNH